MAAFWIGLALHLGVWSSTLLIAIPMLVANAIIMSYIVTNHLLRPLVDHSDPLASSMSLTTHAWMDRIHFNFSHHVEHHLFPSMSPKHAPRVRAKLRQYAPDRFLAPSHLEALRLVFRTPRIHDEQGALVDPACDRRVPFDDLDEALIAATAVMSTTTER
jgi:fatty acid desaturase